MMNYKKLTGVGIVGFGSYVPRLRIKVSEIAAAHGVDGEQIERSLKVSLKSIADWDEDSLTMAYMASIRALDVANIEAKEIGAIYVGSESHPYVVKPTSSILGEALGVGNEYMAADLEFACKAGTAAVQIIASQIKAQVIDYGLAVGVDKAQAEPGDVLEYTAAAGAGALILGRQNLLAKLVGFLSYTSDTSDFWRRDGEKYPRHAGRFTGEPAYFRHIMDSARLYFDKSKNKAADFNQVVFHMPNGKFPLKVAKSLGFSEKQLKLGFIVEEIGNPYSASSILGLGRILESAGANERVLVVSYGSGAGSDVLDLVATPLLVKRRRNWRKIRDNLKYLNYGEYRALYG